jgi:cardiolipin synthase C
MTRRPAHAFHPAPAPKRAPAPAARALLAVTLILLGACAPLAPIPGLRFAEPVAAPTLPAPAGVLARHGSAVGEALDERESAYWLLDDNADSLRIRLALADLAAETLDIQYFIWQDDMTGRLLMKHVLEAADRGVRVRFLLDDLAVTGRDAELASLGAHPSIEVRVFNPWRVRASIARPFEFVARIGLLNHRMHNKVFLADGHFGIIGGRNIGDRYFGVYERFVQNDIDLMIAGPLLLEVNASFEIYWNSPLTRALGRDADVDTVAVVREICESSVSANAEMLAAFETPRRGWEPFLERLLADSTRGAGELLLDSAAVDAERPVQLYERFKQLLEEAEEELILSSPYLVPDATFVALLEGLVERGVRVRILTNSLASNSHVIAHSAYKKWRRSLLAAGAEIYEMRDDAEVLTSYRTPPAEPASLALHTKAAVLDGRLSFIGSPNIDPRSMILNTEIGIVADDPRLAEALIRLLDRDMEPVNSWRVTLEEGGWLKWHSGEDTVGRQPAKGFRQRFVEFFVNLLPIKNQT